MKKALLLLKNFIFIFIVIALFSYIICMKFYPDKMKELTGFQTYVILTDSMEPTIPVGSLVIDRCLDDEDEIKENTIISFNVDRLGDDVIFTHYFKKKEVDESGKERYYTQAENADRYDDYKTYREDILGTYMFHIPYAGKVVQFLQSPFALLELGIILIILLIHHLLWNKFDREEKAQMELQMAENAGDLVLDAPDSAPEQTNEKPGDERPVQMTESDDGVVKVSTEAGTETEEVPEVPYIVNDVLFGYRTAASSGAFENSSAGFTLTVGRNGILRLEVHKKKEGSTKIAVVTLRKKSINKIKRIMKDSVLVIQNLPETLDNGYSVGTGSFFIFCGREVAAWNIKRNNIKKTRLKDYEYYKKYKKNMQYENDVLDIFKKVKTVLKEEGIKLNLDSVEIKAGKQS
ncbi:hypothetical protein CE91St62_15630 [Lachnospiraceae bacterium]|uniref:hypothetical protein n=1 Tax=Extibacter sp. GGCC_0201 TaxID=2731209 RepID=UPI001AA0B7E7|nr:hypothetical protein [Extibacter sp. GGCC_0201]BDF33498.1 hypothetical protein CE91St61_15730 [Lachnospiraceae bacterium]BDF37502.1 hypothetical protein CE91St62_15630 [Lachnospiraceae bacterium]